MKANLNEQIKKNVSKVDKVMKELTQEPVNVLDKSVEAVIKKYHKTIKGSNIQNIHKGILKQLNIKSGEDSQYFDYSEFKKFVVNFLAEIEKQKNESKGE